MKRVTIVDRHSGCPLYDYIKEWKDDERNPSTPAKTIHQFSSIAKSQKEPMVTRVVFEPAMEDLKKVKKRQNYNVQRYGGGLTATSHPSASKLNSTNPLMLARQATLPSIKDTSQEMWCSTGKYCIIAMFIVPDNFKGIPKDYVDDILDRFEQSNGSALFSLQPQFMKMIVDTEKARNDHSFMTQFSTFKLHGGNLTNDHGVLFDDDSSLRMASPLPPQLTSLPKLLLSIDMEDEQLSEIVNGNDEDRGVFSDGTEDDDVIHNTVKTQNQRAYIHKPVLLSDIVVSLDSPEDLQQGDDEEDVLIAA